jgi:hypothetical protein
MRRLVLVVAATVLGLGLLTPTWAEAGCQGIRGEIYLTFSAGWAGYAEMYVGDTFYQADVSFVGKEARLTDDGNFHGIEEAIFNFGSGHSFTERDKFTFGPSYENPEEWHFTGVGRIIEGAGMFDQAYGKLVMVGPVTGPLSPYGFPSVFTGVVKGKVCDIAD